MRAKFFAPVSGWLVVAALAWSCGTVESSHGPATSEPESLGTTAFVDVIVIPMDGEHRLTGQTVIVRDGRIVQIGPVGSTPVPQSAQRISGAGKYLMPGLTDAHFHLQSNADDERLLSLLLANGVTSILNLYGTPAILDLRGRVSRHEVPGPTIYTSGPYISDAPRWQPEADEVEKLIVEQKRAGYDLIKVHGDFSPDAFHRLMTVARREGLKVIGHAPRNLGVGPMFEEHMDAVAHGEEFIYAYFFFGAPDLSQASWDERRRFLQGAEDRIPALVDATANAGIWVVPNLIAYAMIVEQGKDLATVLQRPEIKYLPPRLAAEWQPGRNRYDSHYSAEMAEHMTWRLNLLRKLTGAFNRAGVPMMAGTDAPIPGVMPGFSVHEELRQLIAVGLTPYEALRTATANPARFLGRSSEFGTIHAGSRADLLLLDGDPLRDIDNVTRRAGVMAAGRWFAKDQLRP